VKKKNIYENQSQEIFFLFEEAGNNGKGWLVSAVNAHDAKKQRANMQAALDGIRTGSQILVPSSFKSS
jgi:hypothetical protein